MFMTGMLTLEDFRRVYDVPKATKKQQSGKLWSQFKQRSKHTWLYQGLGSHHVLQTLRNRYLLYLPIHSLFSCSCCNVYNTDHILFCSLLLRVISLTRLPSALVELSEPLQVIRYEHRDFSNGHHDSSPPHSETTCAHTRLAGNTSALTEVSCRCE